MRGSDFVRAIESLLIERGIPKEVFYSQSGISSANMSQWRRGKYDPSDAAIKKAENYFSLPAGHFDQKKEIPLHIDGSGIDEKDRNLINWFRSLPPEKQRAILIAQDGPAELAD